MTTELLVLGLAALLWVVHFSVAAVAANRQLGSDYLMGPRDERRELTGRPARLKRALDNHSEGLLLFAIAALLVTLADRGNAATALAAWLYLAVRVVYVPAYLLGWNPWRSLIWAVGFAATVVILLVGLFG